jgi:2-C-methyl-D-erythritol 4-phosphate cytidylyltransferase
MNDGATAVVVAGGEGRRLGGVPKQLRPLGGRPLLAWSCARLRAHPGIGDLVVVLAAELAADPPDWLVEFGPRVVAGGESRQGSVRRGLDAASGEEGTVLIHDAARPFVSGDLIGRLLDAAESGPVIPVLELCDAIKRIDPEARIAETLDRSRLRGAQTPQAFPLGLIRDLHAQAASGPGAPDDAALCEAAGVGVQTIPGERHALKITHTEDLEFAEWLVETGRVAWPEEE